MLGSRCQPSGLQQRDAAQRAALRAPAARLASGRRMNVQACGIFGIFKRSGSSAVEIYEGLLMLQHRGQDSAGIVSYDGHRFRETKDNGLVKDVFTKEVMKKHEGSVGLGHVRYPTAGSSTAQEAQPFFVNSPLGIYLVRRVAAASQFVCSNTFARRFTTAT